MRKYNSSAKLHLMSFLNKLHVNILHQALVVFIFIFFLIASLYDIYSY